MPRLPDNNSPLSPSEVNAILGLEDAAPEASALFRPKRAGEPQFELESRRDTVLANALYTEARRMKGILDRAPMGPRERAEADTAHEFFMKALLDFLRLAGTDR